MSVSKPLLTNLRQQCKRTAEGDGSYSSVLIRCTTIFTGHSSPAHPSFMLMKRSCLCRLLMRDRDSPGVLYISCAPRPGCRDPTVLQVLYALAHMAAEAGPLATAAYGPRPAGLPLSHEQECQLQRPVPPGQSRPRLPGWLCLIPSCRVRLSLVRKAIVFPVCS